MAEDAGAGQGYVSTELFGGAMEADMPVGFGDVRYVCGSFSFRFFIVSGSLDVGFGWEL